MQCKVLAPLTALNLHLPLPTSYALEIYPHTNDPGAETTMPRSSALNRRIYLLCLSSDLEEISMPSKVLK